MDWVNLTILSTGERDYDQAVRTTPDAAAALDQLAVTLVSERNRSLHAFHFIGLGIGVLLSINV